MKNLAKALILALIVSVTSVCMPSNGRAMLAPAQHAASTDARAADMKKIQTTLELKIVRERLKGLGLTDREIESRLAKLSDREVHKLAKDIDTLSAGGDLGGVLILVIVVLLIVYLVQRVF